MDVDVSIMEARHTDSYSGMLSDNHPSTGMPGDEDWWLDDGDADLISFDEEFQLLLSPPS
jgi:hypothetical protein